MIVNHQFAKPAIILTSGLILTCLTLPVVAAPKQNAISFVGEYKQAQDHRQEADKKLIDNMESVGDWLVQFKLKFGHFPEVGVEEQKATDYLQKKLMKSNPYSVTAIQSNAESKAYCPLRFIHDIGLSDPIREAWEKQIPSDWNAEPGTITIIINEYNNAVIWGAGADHLPIRDYKTNRAYFSWRTFNAY